MIKGYEVFHGFKNYLQKRALVKIIGAQTRLSRSQELACIDLLFSLAPETNEKKALLIHKSLSTLSNEYLMLLKSLIETPDGFRLGGRKFHRNNLSHLRYFIGCGIIFIIESRLKELGISHAEVYQEKLRLAYSQLRLNRQALTPHTNISLKDFVAGSAADHIVINAIQHHPEQFASIIPNYAKAKLKALDDKNTKLDKTSFIVDTYIAVNLCGLIALCCQPEDPQKPSSELETNFLILLAASLILSSFYKLSLLRQKVSVHREKTTMHGLFHKNGQQKIIAMCAKLAHDNLHQSNQESQQGQIVTFGRR